MPEAIFLAGGADSVQRCERCLAEWAETSPSTECGNCAGLLEVVHALPGGRRSALDERGAAFSEPSLSGVWKFRGLVMPGVNTDAIVSHPEGNTPLLERKAVREFAGVASLLLKHEGHNPTGSFKLRIRNTSLNP